ncbi:uncharacterized protein [Phyllobates terribilis]|uniref:uncharacterized protein n=1 Tax=Phyllobates terribilis TaxID=111132 RepID=UPI003CCB2804
MELQLTNLGSNNFNQMHIFTELVRGAIVHSFRYKYATNQLVLVCLRDSGGATVRCSGASAITTRYWCETRREPPSWSVFFDHTRTSSSIDAPARRGHGRWRRRASIERCSLVIAYAKYLQQIEEDSHQEKEVHDDDDDHISGMHPVDLEHSDVRVIHGDKLNSENSASKGMKEFAPPSPGMEFESYDDAYNYYNCYAKEIGFRVRVKNSWFKRHSKEKYGAVLCCSSQGFKRIKDSHRLREETRTGCPAMIRMRLVQSKRWRFLQVILEHNHSFWVKSPKLAKKLKIFKPLVIDAGGSVSVTKTYAAKECKTNYIGFKKGDALAIYNYLCRMQLTNPNFFYLMDFGNEGVLKNVIWVDARSRAACYYFSDVIFLDNSYLTSKYEIPLVAILGVNHHGKSVLLGCGLLSGGTVESYKWFFKIWLKCLSGNSPKTIVTDRCKALETAISEVFPTSHHRFSVSLIMRKLPEKLRKALYSTVYNTMRVIEFEAAWSQMVHYFGVTNDKLLCCLFEERAKWAPVYVRDIFLAGTEEIINPFFEKYVFKQTTLKEFLERYELALYKNHKEEILADIESRDSIPALKTKCPFEIQLCKIYTNGIFQRFQVEVEEMYSCFSTIQLHSNGIYLVKERILSEDSKKEIRDFEVLFNRVTSEVFCVCNCFSFNGFLCRHALSVLNFNEVEEIPARYVVSRWKKDYKRVHCNDYGDNVDGDEKVLRFNKLYESALRVVEEGLVSHEQYEIAVKSLEEAIGRISSIKEKR